MTKVETITCTHYNEEIEVRVNTPPRLLKKQGENKFQFYQLIYISKSIYTEVRTELLKNDIHLEDISSNDKIFCLIEAPNKLAKTLRNYKDYELFEFPDDKFFNLATFMVENNYSIEDAEFLGENYFEDALLEQIEKVFYDGNSQNILKLITNNKLRLNKLKVTNKNITVVFYISGMIYSDADLQYLSFSIRSFFMV